MHERKPTPAARAQENQRRAARGADFFIALERHAVREAGSDACDPMAVRAYIEKSTLAAVKVEHIRNCLACQAEAIEVRKARTDPAPRALLAFLLTACRHQLRKGMDIPFPDGSIAHLRIESGAVAGRTRLLLSRITVPEEFECYTAVVQDGDWIASFEKRADVWRIDLPDPMVDNASSRLFLRLLRKPKRMKQRVCSSHRNVQVELREELVPIGLWTELEEFSTPVVVRYGDHETERALTSATTRHGRRSVWYHMALPPELDFEVSGHCMLEHDGDLLSLACIILDDRLWIRTPEYSMPSGTKLSVYLERRRLR